MPSLPIKIDQREYDKFIQGGDGYPKVGVQVEGLNRSITGLISLSSAGIAEQIPTTPMENRRSLTIYNSSASTVWMTQSSGASGLGIPIDSTQTITYDSHSDIYLVPIFNGQTITYLELG